MKWADARRLGHLRQRDFLRVMLPDEVDRGRYGAMHRCRLALHERALRVVPDQMHAQYGSKRFDEGARSRISGEQFSQQRGSYVVDQRIVPAILVPELNRGRCCSERALGDTVEEIGRQGHHEEVELRFPFPADRDTGWVDRDLTSEILSLGHLAVRFAFDVIVRQTDEDQMLCGPRGKKFAACARLFAALDVERPPAERPARNLDRMQARLMHVDRL